jgi:hypothetical protein
VSVRIYLSGNPVHDYVLKAMHEQVSGSKLCDKYEVSDVAVVFGTYKPAIKNSYFRGAVIAKQKYYGKKVIVIDSGYVKRGDGIDSYYSVALNDINGFGDHKNKNSPSDRWESLGREIKPSKHDGYVLLCGQVPWDASVRRINYIEWLNTTAIALNDEFNGNVIYRPHPLSGSSANVPGVKKCMSASIEESLYGAASVVAYNSNSLVDGVIEGVHAFALGEGHMVPNVSSSSITSEYEMFSVKEREQWAFNLAYAQWHPSEMGLAFERLTV